jgi:hypothetical protein
MNRIRLAMPLLLWALGCDDTPSGQADAAADGFVGGQDASVADMQQPDMRRPDMIIPDMYVGDAQVQVARRLMTWVCDTRFAQEASAEDLQLIDVANGAGTIGIDLTDDPCMFDLVYREGEQMQRLSASPAGYLLAAGVENAGTRVICASRIEHQAADDGGEPDEEGMHLQRETTGVGLECFTWRNGAWSAPQVVIEPNLDFAPWVNAVDALDGGSFQVRYDRDFSFQFLNLTDAGRPEEDGSYTVTLRLGDDGQIEADAPEKAADGMMGAPVAPDANEACPPDFEEGDPRCEARCGDNSCDPGETCADCPQDCGECGLAVDDADEPGYVEVLGEWQTADGLGDSSRWSDDGIAAFTFDGLRPGWKEVWVHHPGGDAATPNAFYRIVEGEDRVLAELIEDQRDAPADWRLLGTVHTQGDFVIELTKTGAGRVYADAIRVDVVEPPEPLVDNGDGLYREVDGAWESAEGGQGGTYRTSSDGHAEYAMPIMPGVYEISVYYPAVPLAAQRVRYAVSVDDTLVSELTLNQRNQADGWLSLGYFALNGLRARLSVSSLDGMPAIADAVRFEARPALVGGGEFVVDDGDAFHTETGVWSASEQGGVDGDARWSRAADATATWQFSGLAPDDYDVLVWVAADARNTIAAEYVITSGPAELGRASIDQTQESGWVSLGRHPILGPSARVTVRQAAAGNLRADQVKLVSPSCEACDR